MWTFRSYLYKLRCIIWHDYSSCMWSIGNASRVQAVANRPQYFSKLLGEHIKNHVRLIRFTQDIEKVFSLMLLALFGSVAITFCIQGFQLINVFTDSSVDLMPITQMIFYIQFLSYCLFLTFVYSWVRENLVTQSQAVHTASCNCNWISCDSLEAKQIILMTFRSQNPLQITAGNLVPLTINTFVQTPLVNIYRKFYGKNVLNFQLLKTSGGYISFLLAVRD